MNDLFSLILEHLRWFLFFFFIHLIKHYFFFLKLEDMSYRVLTASTFFLPLIICLHFHYFSNLNPSSTDYPKFFEKWNSFFQFYYIFPPVRSSDHMHLYILFLPFKSFEGTFTASNEKSLFCNFDSRKRSNLLCRYLFLGFPLLRIFTVLPEDFIGVLPR